MHTWSTAAVAVAALVVGVNTRAAPPPAAAAAAAAPPSDRQNPKPVLEYVHMSYLVSYYVKTADRQRHGPSFKYLPGMSQIMLRIRTTAYCLSVV